MGGLSHLFNFHYGSMAKKVFNHKGHDDGLEAPRNSLELQAENFQSYCDEEDIPYSYQVEKDWPEKNHYPVEASIRKLINEEISKPSDNGRNAPSIVARLMGMDTLPMDTELVVQSNKKHESKGVKTSRRESSKKGSVSLVRCRSESFRDTELDLFYDHNERDSYQWNSMQKPRPRDHPQEEELQKFKKEFLAWQAAKFREYMGSIDIDNISGQFLAQENLNKKKLERHLMSGRTASKEPVQLEVPLKAKTKDTAGLLNLKDKMEPFPTEHKICLPARSKTLSRDWEQSYFLSSPQEVDQFPVPTTIVVLKPGPDKICNHRDSWPSSPSTSEEKCGIEDFLEEVRERLKCEMQGKYLKRGAIARGSGIETPYSEKPSSPRRVARHIGKQVRVNVAKDFEKDLLRSDSTRSYRSELLSNGSFSPESISRDTRKFLTERLKNVSRKESYADMREFARHRSRSSSFDGGNGRAKVKEDPSRAANDMNYWDTLEDEQEMQTRSFRHQPDDGVLEREAPRNLVRSMSAPVSGTSFGKLLLEDRHILTGAHIRRRHEATENVSKNTRKSKRERFNFREKVSHLRYSFGLRGRLFGRKIQSAAVRRCFEQNSGEDLMGRPTLFGFYEKHENFTEVPPSPVSVSSSAHEELWRPTYNASPVSTPDLTSCEDITAPNVFREISSNLKELRRQLNQLDADVPEDTLDTKEHMEPETLELEDDAEAFIRDLLVASGLYDGSSTISISRWDPLAKPISMSVFEEVEKSCRKTGKEDGNYEEDYRERDIDHKVLLDLLNEALSIVLGPPVNCTKFRREIMGYSMLPPPHGRKLLDTVWEIISAYLYPQTNGACTIDGMVACDLTYTPWSGVVDDEVNLIGKELECLIVGDLIEDVLEDIWM